MILVTGATRNIGRHVVEELHEIGVHVRGMSRDPGSVDVPSGVELAHGDLSNPSTLEPALDGIDTVFLVWPQATARNPAAALDAITRAARRIVYVSSLTVREDVESLDHPMTVIHAEIEGLIGSSGREWTFLRAGKLATNTLGWADEIRATGAVRLPYPAAGRSPIVERDVARVAVRALTDGALLGERLVLTGPEVLTECDLVEIIGDAIGRPLRCQEIAPGVCRQEMLADGVSPELADAALAYWKALVTEPEPVTRSVEEVTGSRASTFREWAVSHAGAFGLPS